MGKSDPYLNVYRTNVDGRRTLVYKTEVLMNTLSPSWKEFVVPLATLCEGDQSRPIFFECLDFDEGGGHDLIGTFEVPLKALTPAASFPLINEKKAKKTKGYQNSGTIHIITSRIERGSTFSDFLRGGTELSVMVAIDFTRSNGKPKNPDSLHYRHPTQPNSYAAAIMSVCDILAAYDSDNLYPVYGFGAKLGGVDEVLHRFPLTGKKKHPEVFGVQGIIQEYYRYAPEDIPELFGFFFIGVPPLFSPPLCFKSYLPSAQEHWTAQTSS